MAKRKTIRVSTSLPEEAGEAIKRLADERGTSLSTTTRDLLARGLRDEAFLQRGIDICGRIPDGQDGHLFVIESADGVKKIAPGTKPRLARPKD